MASVSVSHLILFIASLLIAASVAGTLITGVDRVSDAMSSQSLDTTEQIETDITIISDSGSDGMYDGENVTLLVKNTGSTTLTPDVDQVDILINGVYIPSSQITIEVIEPSAEDEWAPGEVVEVTITEDLDPGDNRISVTVRGNEDIITFRVN